MSETPTPPGPDPGRDEHRDLWWESPTVALGSARALDLPEPFRCDHGGELADIQVSWESWGELNAAGDNAVLVVHPMTADCHVTGEWRGQPTGWWEPLVGPGRAIDTDTHFVVCPNLLGGCYGTTGPRFPAPDGAPFLYRFPLLTPRDMMRVQKRFCEALGIRRLAMVIGPSMGGMIAWEWAIEAPDMVDTAVVVAAPLVTTAHQIAMNWLQRRGIELDITGDEVVARFGQVVARGVGMLSYRSPTGLEEKFGREWFQKPGATLAERGRFNIESWLRFHGKRISKRFDPYTWILYSRAMDLHDVSADRGDFVSALDRIHGSVLVLGISSDFLYPPEDVHFGADLLRHLGKDVHYGEIRSLHGHDAFLLETAQIDAILRDHARAGERRVPARAERALRVVRIGILGAGRVATSFARLLRERETDLRERHRIRFVLQAVAETDASKELDAVFDGVALERDPVRLVDREDVDVVLELTRGTDAYPLVERALRRRRPVVTPNKPLVRSHGPALEALAFQNGVRLAYHDSIAAAWPVLYALERPLGRGEIVSIRAMLSSSCNVVLERIAEGADPAAARAEAVARELTEVEPELDWSGWDAAQKLTLLMTRALRERIGINEIAHFGIDSVDPELVRAAPAAGFRVRLVSFAEFTRSGPRAIVRPMAVPLDSHLGAVRDAHHVIVLQTRSEGESVHLGPGVATLPVATAVLNDLLGVTDPRHSWTGRFAAWTRGVTAPEFARHAHLLDGRLELRDAPGDGSVPLLGA